MTQRKHALWSASAAHRNLKCAGALALVEGLPAAPESQAAAWGTAMHLLIEVSLNLGFDPKGMLGEPIFTDRFRFVVDDEMAQAAALAVDYCRSLHGTRVK